METQHKKGKQKTEKKENTTPRPVNWIRRKERCNHYWGSGMNIECVGDHWDRLSEFER